ncbi:MAG TPA: 4-diphosphocytidyl-2C-methyl-D-erythritol kinase [Synergistaceae bacterium]|jgi:4-diphosphocytidyl-2-C-methyl-D-erythritol kinase|nr:4-diphosphocytidyl-2C-methyl-D-erythritol kinase [Synergistaceae bacterium]
MGIVLQSPAKVNCTLRITGRRPDGFHELRSLFLTLSAVESLTITPSGDHTGRDRIEITGETVVGENILEKVLAHARRKVPLPAMEIGLHKVIPPGSGLGGGSGNAAALIRWLNGLHLGLDMSGGEVGSDVPFLVSGAPVALVGGRGEGVEPLAPLENRLSVLVVIPKWSVSTAAAFSSFDRGTAGRTMSDRDAEREARLVHTALAKGERVGLLPNDFLPFLGACHREYAHLFPVMEEAGALGWGLSGSGSAAFGLFPRGYPFLSAAAGMNEFGWVRKILVLE